MLLAMAGRARHPDEKARLEAQAKALRAQGVDMVTVSEAVGVPVPTLYQWAARGKWRFADMAAEQAREALADREAQSAAAEDEAVAGSAASTAPETAAPPAPPPDASPERIARRVLAQSAAAAATGDVVAAEKLARLAQRLVDTVRKAQTLDPDGDEGFSGRAIDPRLERGADQVFRPVTPGDYSTLERDRSDASKRFHDNRLPPGMSAAQALETLDPKDLPILLYKTRFMRQLIRAAKARGEVGDEIDALLTYVPTWAEILLERALEETDELPIRPQLVAYLLDTSERQSDVDAEWTSVL